MPQFDLMLFLARVAYSGATLYMLLVLVQWLAPYLCLDLTPRRWRWVRQITEPGIRAMRRILPFMGPFDFAPLATVFAIWLAREGVVAMLVMAAR